MLVTPRIPRSIRLCLGRDGRRHPRAFAVFSFVVSVFVLWAAAGPAHARAERYAAIVVDARTGEVLHEEDADARRYPASLTKMMTLYLTFEALDDGRLRLDGRLPVSAHAESMAPTKLGVREGQTLLTEHAILGLVTKSANDAAVVLAEALGGSESRFADMMTRKARELGMRNTVFRNASGLPDDGQVTTARDLATLGRALVQDHPKYYPYFSRRTFAYGGRKLPNHNRLMNRYDGMDGIKTGYIRASGFNLAASAVRDGRRLVAVVMGGTSPVARDNRLAALLDDAFARGRRAAPDAALVARATPPSPVITPPSRPVLSEAAFLPDRKPVPQSIGQLASAVAKGSPVVAAEDDWGVQVGAFSSKASGKRALAQASKRLPRGMTDLRPSLTEVPTRKGTVYRARLTGLAETEARSLCDTLRRAGQRCIPVSPSEGL